MTSAVNTEYAQNYTSSEVSQQAGFQFDFFKSQGTSQQSSSWFQGSGTQQSAFSTSLIGGDPSIPSNLAEWNNWVDSFFNFPVPIYNPQFPINVVPLYLLIANQTIQANMIQAVTDYLSANNYPNDPYCMQGTYCSGQCYDFGVTCCSESYCDPSSSVCCSGQSVCCPLNYPECCVSLGVCCPPNNMCCTSSVCCPPGYPNCCGQQETCCGAGYSSCCQSGGSKWCCPDGNQCVTRPYNGCDGLDEDGNHVFTPAVMPMNHSLNPLKKIFDPLSNMMY